MSKILLVFIGGGLGSIVRYLLSQQYNQTLALFSLGTFIANICSCLLLGLLLGLKAGGQLNGNISLLVATGFCGGFSTFSTFSGELLFLGQEKGIEFTLLYLALSIISGLFMIYIGFKIGNTI